MNAMAENKICRHEYGSTLDVNQRRSIHRPQLLEAPKKGLTSTYGTRADIFFSSKNESSTADPLENTNSHGSIDPFAI